jgi:hypothetical protein
LLRQSLSFSNGQKMIELIPTNPTRLPYKWYPAGLKRHVSD